MNKNKKMTNKTKKKKPFESIVNADDVEFTCPCGDFIQGEGEDILDFIKEHKSHTNGKCYETISSDGARFISPQKRTYKIK